MHAAALARAALPAPTVILGMLMRPYSLGHELYLIREGSPLVGDSIFADVNFGHLRTAVFICCQTWDENRRAPFDMLIKFKLWLWERRIKKAVLPIEIEKFRAYRREGSQEFPPSDIVRPDREQGRLPGAPFLLRLQQWLMLRLGLSESAAWDYPYGLAQMRFAAYWEDEGCYEVKNEHEAEFERFIAEQEAKGANRCQA